VIYFIQSGSKRGAVKIGYVREEHDCHRRMATLQIGNPEKLRLLALVPGTREQEAALHARLRGHHIRRDSPWLDDLIEGRATIPLVDDSDDALRAALLQAISADRA
jgi:hypothetical protein